MRERPSPVVEAVMSLWQFQQQDWGVASTGLQPANPRQRYPTGGTDGFPPQRAGRDGCVRLR